LQIVFLVESLATPGGTERQCVELARGLVELGHSIVILTLEGTLGVHHATLQDRHIEFRSIGRSAVGRYLSRIHPKIGQAWEMVRLGLSAGSLPPEWMLVPHHYPAHWAATVARLLSSHVVVWVCNDWSYSPLEQRNGVLWRLRRLRRVAMIAVDGSLARRYAAVLTLSDMTRQQVEAGYRVKAHVFRTGATGPTEVEVNPASRRLAKRTLGIPETAFVVSCICIVMPHRRIEDILQGIASLEPTMRGLTYFLHGGGFVDDAARHELESCAQALGIRERVRFLGPVSEDERIRLLAASSVFVFPVERQSWGLAPLEALANEVPTIISSASGVAEVLRAGKHVECYRPGDIQVLAAHLETLYRDQNHSRQLARAGRQRWEKRFTWSRAARRLARRLNHVFDGHR
jgi:glycosyltransferase involved in cell wall biosynthesis